MESYFKSKNIHVDIDKDKEILKQTVDFVAFSYYASRTSIADPSRAETNTYVDACNQYDSHHELYHLIQQYPLHPIHFLQQIMAFQIFHKFDSL